jgi:peptidoglycan hydrolase-like protein with peptidoglycan-binding domain
MIPLLVASDEHINEVQEQLTDLGLYTSIIDGDFGKGTKAAVEKLHDSLDPEQTGITEIGVRICLDRSG